MAGVILVFGTFGTAIIILKEKSINIAKTALVQPVLAADIYPEFVCPCCGQPLDPNNICCGSAQERIDYINSLVVKPGMTKDEIILTYVKKYGLNSFKDKDQAETFKNKIAESAPQERPIVALSPASFNLGEVSQKKGEVSTTFTVKNNGQKDLVIDKLETSCGCTTASIVFNGQEGPRFGMPGHGLNEDIKDWQVVIPPAGEAKLNVYYDPKVHLDFRGYAIREISIFSNDPVNFEERVKVELNQVD